MKDSNSTKAENEIATPLKEPMLKSYVKKAVIMENIKETKFKDLKVLTKNSDNMIDNEIEVLLMQRPMSLRRLRTPTIFIHPIPKDKVKVLISTGNGHYPSFFGFLGKGMLSAVVYGKDVFRFPSSSFIGDGIKAITTTDGETGCLLIVRNYVTNRLNCGMASEQANLVGRKTELVIVSDDCFVPRSQAGKFGSQGVAGSLFVAKIAGAAADQGKSLSEVTEIAKIAASRIGSLSVELETGKLTSLFERKNSSLDSALAGDNVMIGVGMHGEKGVKSPMVSTDYIANNIVYKIYEYGYIPYQSKDVQLVEPGEKVAVLINNVGRLSAVDLQVFSHCILKYLEGEPIACFVVRLYVGTYMTSLDMKGASVSILYLDEEDKLLSLLDYPTDAPEWKSVDNWDPESTFYVRPSFDFVPQKKKKEPEYDDLESFHLQINKFDEIASKLMKDSCEALIACEQILDSWGSVAGSEMFGFKICRAAQEILSTLQKEHLNLQHPIELFQSLQNIIKKSCPSFTFGNLLSFLFRQMRVELIKFQKIIKDAVIDKTSLQKAFSNAIDKLSFYTGATVGQRTFLDALIPAAELMKKKTLNDFEQINMCIKKGTESTMKISQAGFGHAYYQKSLSYVGYPDVGAMVVAIIFDAFQFGSESAIDYAVNIAIILNQNSNAFW